MPEALSVDRRREIAEFLKNRRARLSPEDVGLPRGRRRRTAGLRREEVAFLAGISVEWYKRIEQAREVRASAGALEDIAVALRLEPSERRHLMELNGYAATPEVGVSHNPSPGRHVQLILDRLVDCPAWVVGARWDYFAWNDAAKVITPLIDYLDGLQLNALTQFFLAPEIRERLVDWDRHARNLTGMLRSDHARWIEDPWYVELIDYLEASSAEFRALWTARDLPPYQDGDKEYAHPKLGRLSFTYTAMRFADAEGTPLTMIVYVPIEGTETRERVRRAGKP